MKFLSFIKLYVLRYIMAFFLRILAPFIKVEPKTVLFVSFGGKSYSDSPRYLFEYMKKQPKFSDYRFVWALNSPKKIEGAETVKFNSFKYFYVLLQAKYWFFNSKMAPYYYKKPSQIYLQTWHGTPLKRLGHDIADNGSTYYRSRQTYDQMVTSYDNDSRHWDYLVSPNAFSSEVFSSAFNFPRKKMLETGYPRMDRLVENDQSEVTKLKQEFGIPSDKKVILYAPTWRDNSFALSGYTFQLQVDFHKWYSALGDNYVVIFKPHYLIASNYEVPDDLTDFVFLMGANADIDDAYLMSDVLVTDYSSVFFDYAVLDRPIYFYMYDFDEYEGELRGFYLNVPEDLPNSIDKTEDELLAEIKHGDFDYERLAKFNQRFNLWNDGRSSAKIIAEVFDEN
ncbi:CDP-glycerol glycerophosphotransferase family protein [Ligilactobacillus pobuzihii]|uniref:CDP-glycerol glycerophosphotransferase family protein n=1 Tax=Ligilactobacillus pobuzihii TaxID=449659 RepID=UPI0019D190B4|nr:CDP-glycerol glycerophosphotransferase family protein [Ligilactobacillus pobuzihii]MBN7275441.1 CDP-glycerol glycerophosphotransferase family protein [Ligilactobacillus pobuzihii]